MRYRVEVTWHPSLDLHDSAATIHAPTKKVAELFVLIREPRAIRAVAIPVGRPSLTDAYRELKSFFTGVDDRRAVHALERNLALDLGYLQGFYDQAANRKPKEALEIDSEEQIYRDSGAITHFLENEGTIQDRWPPIGKI
jgi:hypothetical protein